MQFSILAGVAALAASAVAVPIDGMRLAERSVYCWSSSNTAATTEASPLAADCQALSETKIFESEPWVPTEENHYTFEVHSGTCGLKGTFKNPDNSSLPADQMELRNTLVSLSLTYAVDSFAVDGKVGATGAWACEQPGQDPLLGFVGWELYSFGQEKVKPY
ncbi:hypothetical protein OQA88_9109 [Cercophora sp. LCS_1]